MYLRREDNHLRRCYVELHLHDTSILVGWIYHYKSSPMVVPGTASGSILFVGHLGALDAVVLVAELLPSLHRAARALYKEGSLFSVRLYETMALESATGLGVFATRVVYPSDCPSSRELNTDLITKVFVYTGQTWLMPNMFDLVSQRNLRTCHVKKERASPALADGLVDEAAHGVTSLICYKSHRRLFSCLIFRPSTTTSCAAWNALINLPPENWAYAALALGGSPLRCCGISLLVVIPCLFELRR